MDQQKGLLISNVYECKDELEERLERCYNAVTSLVNGLSEREANDALNSHVCKGAQQHEEVQIGLLYAILTDPANAPKHYRDINLVTRDSFTIMLNRLNQIVFEKWLKLKDIGRSQILWLTRELVKNSVLGADGAINTLLRQIAGGDITPKNVWLAESVLDILAEYRSWLDKFPGLVPTVIYTFLRVIVYHTGQIFHNLRQREAEFTASLLRDKWTECMGIGRDLVRLLQNVARLPEFESLWRDVMLKPTVLAPNFTGIQQLLGTRTSRKYQIARLTPDMENKLIFLTTKVKFGQHKRYQDWFQRQYLSTPESQSLRCDLIRYICCVFHPSNELLCSDIIPRWAVIGWLLQTCTSNVAASNAKLSLFYDWIFFDPEKDSIMNIEPAVLVMFYSIKPHPAITATLLDFLCRIMNNFCPMYAEQVRSGIHKSLKTILDKRVLPSLQPLFENPKLDKELRALVRTTFTEFMTTDMVKGDEEESVNKEVASLDMDEETNHIVPDNDLSDAAFSDDEDESPLANNKTESTFRPIRDPQRYQSVDITEHLQQLDGDIRYFTEQLLNETVQEDQCEKIDRLMQMVVRDDEDFDGDMAAILATCLCQILIDQFNTNIFPEDIDDESLEESIGTPLFVMLRFLSSTQEESPSRAPLFSLLGEMYLKQPRIGYNLLYFLKVGKANDEKMQTYRDFVRTLEDGHTLESCLLADMKICEEDDVRLFTFLLPDIYTQFPNVCVGNAELLQLVVSSIDGSQLQELICQILQGNLVMFRKESFLKVLNASLDWETLEQYFLWQLITAHNIPLDYVMPMLPKLDYHCHAEALTSIMVLLKQDCPSSDLLRPILCRECKKNDFFTVSILNYWAQEFEDKLADLIYTQFSKVNGGTPNKKRLRPGSTAKKDSPSTDQILAHLDHMRQICRNISLLQHSSIQTALQQIQQTASDSQKTKFSDLLALAEDIADLKTSRVLRGLPGRRAAAAAASSTSSGNKSSSAGKSRKLVIDDSESESSSSEEEAIKPRAKKRKKAPPVDDDSD
ncbi:integrator complex subunit 3-like [Mya arenaria]|uniref:integrator complex subunit 3-like n=1 Tax=Mya arenaria TaxID=6604 RepID=UPI0022E9393D|nr:integrator complex subunit 3-like [Mya arenaria]